MTALHKVGSLAFRVEGQQWNAYWALPNTMEGAIFLASIPMAAVTQSLEVRKRFMDLMREVVSTLIPVEEFDGFRLKEAMAEIEAAEARGSGWRPIATAPTDREVLMYFPTNSDSPVGIGWWTRQWEMQSLGIPHIEDHLGSYFQFPTHWMPLPDPPKAEP